MISFDYANYSKLQKSTTQITIFVIHNFFYEFYLLFCEEIVVSFSKYLLDSLLQKPPDNVEFVPRLE